MRGCRFGRFGKVESVSRLGGFDRMMRDRDRS
jgi:hypothetical protein